MWHVRAGCIIALASSAALGCGQQDPLQATSATGLAGGNSAQSAPSAQLGTAPPILRPRGAENLMWADSESGRPPVPAEALAQAPPARPAAAAKPVRYASVWNKDIPHVRQKPDFCGEACVEMYLKKLGARYDQDYVFDQSELDPALGRGCYTAELAKALSKLGFKTGPVWATVPRATAARDLDAQFAAMHADLVAGVPSIVCMHYDERPQTTEHFRLIVGYRSDTDEVYYHEPAEDDGANRHMPREKFLRLWPLSYHADALTVIRMRLEAGKLPRVSIPAGHTDADFAQHIMRLKARLPNEQFSLVLQKPFVVVGDEGADVVKERSKHTVKWAVDQLKASYFQRDPTHIIDVWLFKDEDSYKKHTKLLWDDTPSTPYGYYSATHRALVMNISTGGGTLVHEICHPFMATNFPTCPSWFNEGLASLYEQCGTERGGIYGYTNWRLGGLQAAIQAKRVPTFETLCNTTTNEFYREDTGTNYSQARYLCYYLQEQGLLQKYYQQFVARAKDDPSGYATLQAVLEEKDMAAFQKKWEAYVLKLRR